jgi:hypothetical protein
MEREGADGSAFGIARLTDDLDRATIDPELIRAKSGGDDPFNLQLSGLPCTSGSGPRRNAWPGCHGRLRTEGGELHSAWGLRGVALVAAHQGRLVEARRLAGDGLALALERGDPVVVFIGRSWFRGCLGREWPKPTPI